MANGGSSKFKSKVLPIDIRKKEMAESAQGLADIAHEAASDESIISQNSNSKELHMTNALVRFFRPNKKIENPLYSSVLG